MRTWDMENATARFSELLEASLQEGPQLITRGGIAVAVLIAVERWHRLQDAARPTLRELLLADVPRAETPIPRRGQLRRRTPAALG